MAEMTLFKVGTTAISLGDAALALSTIAGIGGAVSQSNALKAQGEAAQRNAIAQQQAQEHEALVLDQQAGQERAVAQREAIETRRQSRLLQSDGLATAAASGAGALDPGVVDLLGDIEAEGEYRALIALQQGEEKALGLESAAVGSRFEGTSALAAGRAQRSNSRLKSSAALVSGVGSALPAVSKLAGKTIAGDTDDSLYSRYG